MGNVRPELNGTYCNNIFIVKDDDNCQRSRICKCFCGKEFSARVERLKTKSINNCGCLPRNLKESLLSKGFDKLTVISYYGFKHSRISWWCKCDCGNELAVSGKRLTNGITKNCGCVEKAVVRKARESYTKEYIRLIKHRAAAKKANVPFSLDEHDLRNPPDTCPVFGVKMQEENIMAGVLLTILPEDKSLNRQEEIKWWYHMFQGSGKGRRHWK